MNNEIIEKYKKEMLKMYNSQKIRPVINNTAEPTPQTQPSSAPQVEAESESTGKLIAIVTTVRNLYPVEGARVTVFEGDLQNMNVIATAFTDQSGRTREFNLSAPSKELSQQAGSTTLPYAVYNMMVESDGYLDNIHLNIPVFSDTVSLQRSNLMLSETAGEDKGPRIYDELQQFNL